MQKAGKSTSLTQTVYTQLRNDLLACRIRPGERLRINELALLLAVSLGAVREALSRLTSEGLVIAEPQRGFLAAPVSAAELRDLTIVWIDSETACLRRAIRAGDVAWETHLVATHHRLSRTAEREPGHPQRVSDEWAHTHADYHRALVAGGDSPWLLRLREMLYAQTERYRRLSVPLAMAERDLGREHREIMEATLARDADAAAALLTSHIQTTTAIVLETAWFQTAKPAPPRLTARLAHAAPPAGPQRSTAASPGRETRKRTVRTTPR